MAAVCYAMRVLFFAKLGIATCPESAGDGILAHLSGLVENIQEARPVPSPSLTERRVFAVCLD